MLIESSLKCIILDDRQKRSPDKYDQQYSKFIERHFADLNGKYVDEKDEYKSASAENAEEDEENHEDIEEENDEEGGDTKANVQESDDDDTTDDDVEEHDNHDFAYRNNNDYERIKALSEKQVEELHKKPGNCKHYEKDGMICAECKDPETGDTSEVKKKLTFYNLTFI